MSGVRRDGGSEPAEDPKLVATGMTLADISIRNHVFAWILMIALIGFGVTCYTGFGDVFQGLGISQNPDVDYPIVSVSVSWEGASPEIMETDVVDVLEDAVTTVGGVTFVVLSIAVALAAMLIPAIFVPAGIALECRRVGPNEGTCEIKTYRLLGSSFAAIPIQQISHAEAVRVDSKDDEGNPQICYRVDLQFDDARSAWLTGCHLDAGQAQKLAASVNDFVGDKAKTALSHYDSEPWIFLTAIFLGAVVFLGIGILLLLKIMRQKKPVPSWRDRPSPSPFGILSRCRRPTRASRSTRRARSGCRRRASP